MSIEIYFSHFLIQTQAESDDPCVHLIELLGHKNPDNFRLLLLSVMQRLLLQCADSDGGPAGAGRFCSQLAPADKVQGLRS